MKKSKVKHIMKMQEAKKNNLSTIVIMVSIVVIIVGVFGIIFMLTKDTPGSVSSKQDNIETPVNNVNMVDGKQVVEVSAKGGYSPRKTIAKAGIPTILRLKTNGTFDCSSAIRIPSLSISKNLPATGTTDIDLNSPQPGLFTGICSMGMYSFEIDFQS